MRRFPVRGANGDAYTVVEYRDFFQSMTYVDDGSFLPGLRRLATTTGEAVATVGPGAYRIVRSGVIVWPEQQGCAHQPSQGERLRVA